MDTPKKVFDEMQRICDEPLTKESYARVLELFQEFLKLADTLQIPLPNQAASISKRETLVVALGAKANQSLSLTMLIAVAMASCWKWVLV
jgi:hypothetical protein